MRKPRVLEGQGSLFEAEPPKPEPVRTEARKRAGETRAGKWTMPEVQGSTVAEIRLLWSRRLTPGQAARVEAELAALPTALAKLGFGKVKVERAFVRRRKQ